MIDLYTAATPNGHKVSIMLEELGVSYTVRALRLSAEEQKEPWHLALNPNGRIPTIVDHDNDGFTVFESGAILIYLAEKTGSPLLPADPGRRSLVLQWLMFQTAGVGPMQGQAHVFVRYAPEQIPYAITRYKDEVARLYRVLDTRLRDHEYLAGDYSIADIATWPWVRIHFWADVPIDDGLTPMIIETLLAAAATLPRPDLVAAARRGGDWLLAVQQPPPRPGWAQQYDEAGRPAAMRRFEPPALATWESRHAVDALDALVRATGDRRWCPAARAAAAWLRDAALSPGCWARFHALDDGTPLYLDADGGRVATVLAARAGYDWQGDFGISFLLRRLELGDTHTPGAPLPGVPGACPGAPDPLHGVHDVRSLIAQAGLQLAALAPAPISSCAGAPLAVVDAGGLR